MSTETISDLLVSTDVIVIVGAILGAAAATLFPYWSKLREQPDLIFERKFLGTALVSIVASAAIAIGLFPALLEQANQMATGTSLGAIFAMTALTAFGLTRASNMVMPSSTSSKTNGEAATSSKTTTTPSLPPPGNTVTTTTGEQPTTTEKVESALGINR